MKTMLSSRVVAQFYKKKQFCAILMKQFGFQSYFRGMATQQRVIDLRSDTVTKPSQGMKKAMFEAEIGDDVFKEDPTVNALEQYVADMMGMEAALFVPSGSMSNLLAVMSHCSRRGSEMVVGKLQHMHKYEQGSFAQFGGVSCITLDNQPDGTMLLEDIRSSMHDPADPHQSYTELICLESPNNMCGGIPLTLDYMDKVQSLAREYNCKVHLDGARMFGAAVALGVSVKEIAQRADSVSLCLSKTLACPIGSVLAGEKHFIDRALRTRKALGGGMRQAGILAAAGLFTFKDVYANIAKDHEKCRKLADGLRKLEKYGVKIMNDVITNMFFVYIPGDNIALCEALKQHDPPIIATPYLYNMLNDWLGLRLITHCDVTMQDMDTVVNAIHDWLRQNVTNEH